MSFASGLDGGLGDVPVVAEEEEGQHLVADIVGATRDREGGFLFLGHAGRWRGQFVDDVLEPGRCVEPGQCFLHALCGVCGGCCDGTHRKEDEQDVGWEHSCGVSVGRMEGEWVYGWKRE